VVNRRTFITTAAGSLAVPLLVVAQQSATIWRIGVLLTGASPLPGAPSSDPLERGLREYGYEPGKNLTYVVRAAEGRSDRLPVLAADLVQLKVDAIVTFGSEATRAAQHATRSIPIVFVGPSHPVEEELVATLARPGGNLTGLSSQQADIIAKTLQLLRDVTPTLSEVAVVWNPAIPSSRLLLRDLENAAAGLGLKIQRVVIASASDMEPAFSAIARTRAGAMLVHSFPLTMSNVPRIAEFAIKNHLPTISTNTGAARRGLLMSYGPNFIELERRVAGYLDRIFKGAKAGDLPVEQPTKFDLVINLKTAKALGVTIPQSLLLRADEVIQ